MYLRERPEHVLADYACARGKLEQVLAEHMRTRWIPALSLFTKRVQEYVEYHNILKQIMLIARVRVLGIPEHVLAEY